MWKLFLGFLVFAALAMWMLNKGGAIDMGGEKHGIEVPESAASAASGASASH